MKVCLVSASTATDFEDPSDANSADVRASASEPHLGVLALAAVLDARGVPSDVVDLNRTYYDFLGDGGGGGLEHFASWAAGCIATKKADIYGFSSICSSYPLTVRIAEQLKLLSPSCTILFGGPQASVVDRQTLSAFPFVDFVLRGEADGSLPRFVDEWIGARQFSTVPGVTYRTPFGPARTGDAPLIADLDTLPLPAYDRLGGLRGAPRGTLELGRGCPFACNFCSTNDFFRRKFRVKSPGRMLSDMRALSTAYGVRKFDLVHDMFTVDRKRVVEFCEEMLKSGEGFSWACSARTDCVDPELLELMARAGCYGMFFGVESGSARMQQIIEKDLDPEYARVMISHAERLGIETTVSLITGFPDETFDDLRETTRMYMYSLRHAGSSPQLNLLAPLAETPIHTRFRFQLILEELCSDMSHQGRTQNEADRELIRRYPDIFPNFYLVPSPGLDRSFCLELREFLLMGVSRLRWLFAALEQCSSGMLDVFARWRECRDAASPGLAGGLLRHYYTSKAARADFLRFVREHIEAFSGPLVRSLLDCEEALTAAIGIGQPEQRQPDSPRSGHIDPAAIPLRAPGVHVIRLPWDVQRAIEALKSAAPPLELNRATCYRTAWSADRVVRLVEISELVGWALETCDGRITVAEFVEQAGEVFDCSADLRSCVAHSLLQSLQEINLIGTAPKPSSPRSSVQFSATPEPPASHV